MSDSSARRVHLTVSGRVQGVSFRAYTERTARSLGLTGWVRNLPSGEVEIVAEGASAAIDRLVEWARVGPSLAHVDSVEVEVQPAIAEFSDFRIR
jgi:acylphosphatase